MAEERIMICSSTDYTITETDKGDLFNGKIEPHNANVFTRTEAIEKMAKKRFEAEYGKRWEETTDEYKGYFLKTAETMLNALLGE